MARADRDETGVSGALGQFLSLILVIGGLLGGAYRRFGPLAELTVGSKAAIENTSIRMLVVLCG